MPLDPQAREYLDKLASVGIPALDAMTISEIRSLAIPISGQLDDIASRQDRDIHRLSTIEQLPGDSTAPATIQVRIYWPRGFDSDQAPRPGIMFFHGGGWVMGNRTVYDSLCHLLCNSADAVVVSVEYRLAPEHRFPAAVNDAYAATMWVAMHAEELAIDPSQLMVCGDSAGGNLAAAVCLMARDFGQDVVSHQILVYPVTNHHFDTPSYRENGEGFFLTRESMKWFWRQYLETQDHGSSVYCSPLRESNLAGLPSAFVMTAEYDPLRDEGEQYAERLREAGVDVSLTRFDGQIHGFLRRTDLFDRAREAINAIGDMVRMKSLA